MGAINAYMRQEEVPKESAAIALPHPEIINPWRLFGRQELMRARTRWRVRRTNR